MEIPHLVFLQLATWVGVLALLGCVSFVFGKNPRSRASLTALFTIIAYILLKFVMSIPSPLHRINGLFLLFNVLLCVFAVALGFIAWENNFAPLYTVLAIAAGAVFLLTMAWILPWMDILIFKPLVHISLRIGVVFMQVLCLVLAIIAPAGRLRV